jgi:hypothetical protein
MGFPAKWSLQTLHNPSRKNALTTTRRAGNIQNRLCRLRKVKEGSLKPFTGVLIATNVGRLAITKNCSDDLISDAKPRSDDANVDRLIAEPALPHQLDNVIFPPIEGIDFPAEEAVKIDDDVRGQIANKAAIIQADITD